MVAATCTPFPSLPPADGFSKLQAQSVFWFSVICAGGALSTLCGVSSILVVGLPVCPQIPSLPVPCVTERLPSRPGLSRFWSQGVSFWVALEGEQETEGRGGNWAIPFSHSLPQAGSLITAASPLGIRNLPGRPLEHSASAEAVAGGRPWPLGSSINTSMLVVPVAQGFSAVLSSQMPQSPVCLHSFPSPGQSVPGTIVLLFKYLDHSMFSWLNLTETAGIWWLFDEFYYIILNSLLCGHLSFG